MFPKRFLPAPVKVCRTQAGPQVPLPNDEKASDTFPLIWDEVAAR